MRAKTILTLFLLSISLGAQDVSGSAELRAFGEPFCLLQRRVDSTLDSEEYIPKGDSPAEWSQLLGIQRLRKNSTPEELASFLSGELGARPGGKAVLREKGEKACLLLASLPAENGGEAEELVCYISTSQALPGVLEVLHYTLKPARVEAGSAEIRLRSWYERLLARAKARNAGPGKAGGGTDEG